MTVVSFRRQVVWHVGVSALVLRGRCSRTTGTAHLAQNCASSFIRHFIPVSGGLVTLTVVP